MAITSKPPQGRWRGVAQGAQEKCLGATPVGTL